MRDLLGVRRYPRFGDTILHSSLQSAATLLVHLHAEAGGAVAEGGAPFALAVGGEVELIVLRVPAGVEAELQPPLPLHQDTREGMMYRLNAIAA